VCKSGFVMMSTMAISLVSALHLLLPAVLAQITALPKPDFQVAAIETTDIGYRACTLAEDRLDYCQSILGNDDDAFVTAPSLSVFKCACCISTTPISNVFSTCATYLRTELPNWTSEYTC
jgi:hypothetical protein